MLCSLLGSHQVSLVQLSGVLTVALVPSRAQQAVTTVQAVPSLLDMAATVISGQL